MQKKKWLTLAIGLAMSSAVLAAEPPQVSMKTTLGEIIIELDQDKAPISVANFLGYVKSGYYKDTIFHRVIDGFMVQGGGFTQDLKPKPGVNPPIRSESRNGLKNNAYTIAMARMGNPNSASSQFYINVADNAGLDYPMPDGVGYTVFGRVIQGQQTVDKIKVLLVDDKQGFQNVPVKPVTITAVTILKKRIKVAPPAVPAPAEPAPETAAPAPQPEPVK
jgi:peptidyl-prolyl cis-trans isomerase A (cyclophilin A)